MGMTRTRTASVPLPSLCPFRRHRLHGADFLDHRKIDQNHHTTVTILAGANRKEALSGTVTITCGDKQVTVNVSDDNLVTVKGPKGTLSEQVNKEIKVELENGVLTVARPTDSKPHKSMHGLYRALINNMVTGVTAGFQKTLLMEGVGYRAQIDGKNLVLNVGYSHPVTFTPPENVTFEAPQPTTIIIKGISKQVVGEIAADIRKTRKPEPYLGKGIRYENEHIRRKEGKAGKK